MSRDELEHGSIAQVTDHVLGLQPWAVTFGGGGGRSGGVDAHERPAHAVCPQLLSDDAVAGPEVQHSQLRGVVAMADHLLDERRGQRGRRQALKAPLYDLLVEAGTAYTRSYSWRRLSSRVPSAKTTASRSSVWPRPAVWLSSTVYSVPGISLSVGSCVSHLSTRTAREPCAHRSTEMTKQRP